MTAKHSTLPVSYRLAVLSRVLAAVLGGYVLTALASVCLTLWVPMARADAAVTGMTGSFPAFPDDHSAEQGECDHRSDHPRLPPRLLFHNLHIPSFLRCRRLGPDRHRQHTSYRFASQWSGSTGSAPSRNSKYKVFSPIMPVSPVSPMG